MNNKYWWMLHLLILLTLGGFSAVAQEGNTLVGFVNDEVSYTPIENARIEVLNYYPPKIAYTDASGKFMIQNLNVGKHRVLISNKGYYNQERGFEIFQDKASEMKVYLAEDPRAVKTLEQNLTDKTTTTASQTAESFFDAPATTYIISNQEIVNRGYRTLIDVLEDIPEFEIQERSDNKNYNKISIRGIEGVEKFIILQDGVRLNSGVNTKNIIDKNISIVHAQRIEIVMGTASALYGANAFSAVINIITKSGQDIMGLQVNSTYGMYHTTEQSVVAGWQSGDFSAVINGNFYLSAEPRYYKRYAEEFSWYNNVYQNTGEVLVSPFAPDTISTTMQPYRTPRLAYDIHAKINWRAWEFGASRHLQTHSSASEELPEYAPRTRENRVGSVLNNAYLQKLWWQHNKDIGAKTLIHWNNYELLPLSQFNNTYTNYTPVYKYAYNHTALINQTFQFEFSPRHRFVMGGEFQYSYALPSTPDLPFEYDRQLAPDEQGFYYIGTNVTGADGTDLSIPQELFSLQQMNGGALLQYQTNIKDMVSITLGGRYDYNRYWTEDRQYTATYQVFNPRLGLVVKPKDNWRVKMFYGEAFLAPSPEERFEQSGSFITLQDVNGDPAGFVGTFWHVPNPDSLLPQRMRSAEVRASYVRGNLNVSGGSYFNAGTRLIGTDITLNDEYVGVPVVATERYVNNKTLYTIGITIRGQYRHFFDKNKEIQLDAYSSYTYSNGWDPGASFDFPIPYNSKHTFRFGTTFQYKKLDFHIRGIYRSASFSAPLENVQGDLFVNKANGYFLLNMHSKYEIWYSKYRKVGLEGFINIRNLGNARYYHVADSRPANLSSIPQAPIRITIGVLFNFNHSGIFSRHDALIGS